MMGPITSIAAGLAAAVGAVALLRMLDRRRAANGRPRDERSRGTAPQAILDFELDRNSGVYRSK